MDHTKYSFMLFVLSHGTDFTVAISTNYSTLTGYNIFLCSDMIACQSNIVFNYLLMIIAPHYWQWRNKL